MSTLAATPGLDQTGLAQLIAYDRATIGGVIKRLAQKGWVSRQPDDVDRRAFKVTLTQKGAAFLAKLTPVVLALQSDILRALTVAEREILLGLMARALKTDEE